MKMRMEIDPTIKILTKRGVQPGGEVQKYIDKAVMENCDPYAPLESSTLKNSPIGASVLGSGKVIYNTPYAARMYYNPQYHFTGAPMRGAYWFERMKADKRDTILRGAAKVAGSEAK